MPAAAYTYHRDSDGTLVRANPSRQTDVWWPGAGEWHRWQVDWSDAPLTEITTVQAREMIGSGDLAAPNEEGK